VGNHIKQDDDLHIAILPACNDFTLFSLMMVDIQTETFSC